MCHFAKFGKFKPFTFPGNWVKFNQPPRSDDAVKRPHPTERLFFFHSEVCMKRQNFGKLSVLASGILALVVGAAPQNGWAQTTSMVVTEPAVAGQPGNVGMGIDNPARQLHLQGPNAVFRMDRDRNSAAFLITRTARGDFSTPLKTFALGVDADGPNDGSFVINDLGVAVSGGGARRLTIDNTGTIYLGAPGSVTGAIVATNVMAPSALRFKSDVKTISDAGGALERLRGVSYVSKSSGEEAIGLVAEEVAEVYPQLVRRDPASGQVDAVNYAAMVAVLIEGYKLQAKKLAAQQAELGVLNERLTLLEGSRKPSGAAATLAVAAP